MKNRAFLLLFLLLVLTGCQRRTSMPERGNWRGTVQLEEGIVLPFRMSLDLSGPKPSGHFLVDEERTPIPEISRDGDSLVFVISEYSAEVRANWDGSQLTGNYLRIRSDGTKSLRFKASPEIPPSD